MLINNVGISDFAAVASQSLGYAIGNSLFSPVDAKEQMLEHIELQNGGGRAAAERIYQQSYSNRVVSGNPMYINLAIDFVDRQNGNSGLSINNGVKYAASGMIGSDASWQYPGGAGIDGNPILPYSFDEFSHFDQQSLADFNDPLNALQSPVDGSNFSSVGKKWISVDGLDYSYEQVQNLMLAVSAGNFSAGTLESATKVMQSLGYRAGVRNDAEISAGLPDDQKMDAYRGKGTASLNIIKASAQELLGSLNSLDLTNLNERYEYINYGGVTRLNDDGSRRTIKFIVPDDATALAGQLEISRAEAIAKTDWSVIKGTIDSAFATNANGVLVNEMKYAGFWRPSKELWNAFADKNWVGQERTNQLISAGIITKNKLMTYSESNENTWKADWGTTHNTGNAVDITAINGIAVRNGQAGGAVNEPDIVRSFTRELVKPQNGGAQKVLYPWNSYESSGWNGKVDSRHHNHLHVSY